MIQVTLNDNGYVVEGHAGYNEIGRDIVCSAVSALSQTTAMALREHTVVFKKVEEGMMSVYITKSNREVRALLKLLRIGIHEISNQFPNHVKYTYKGDRDNEEN